MTSSIVNALTIDVEDYFQVSAFAGHIDRSQWEGMDCRVERNVTVILEMLRRHDAKATFFTLGWIAERYPQVVHAIVRDGHELASHGYAHLRASEQTPEEFSADIRRAKTILEDLSGTVVKGYRAPSFSISAANLWALDCIRDAGYVYSSSIYPVRHDHYGMPDAPRFSYQSVDRLIEVPPTTLRLFERNWPAAGGGFFRLLPYVASRWSLSYVNRVDDRPGMFYFHPWEIDPGQPRIPGIGLKTRFRHYLNLHRMQPRLERLLRDFKWDRMDRVFLEPSQLSMVNAVVAPFFAQAA